MDGLFLLDERFSATARRCPFVTSRVLEYISSAEIGVEISPYFNPFLNKEYFRVDYTDCRDNEFITAKALENPSIKPNDIPLIDFVWDQSKPFSESVPADRRYSYAVASHVLEHVPNPIGWIKEVLDVLTSDGALIVFLPTRQRNADWFRSPTTVSQLVTWYIEKPTVPTVGQVTDFLMHTIKNSFGIDMEWAVDGSPIDAERAYQDEESFALGQWVHNEKSYLDVHCTVWEERSIRQIFERIIGLGILDAELVGPFPSTDDRPEIAFVLKKGR